MALVCTAAAPAQPESKRPPQPTPLTGAQQERLKERDRLASEVGTLRAAGKFAEAAAACLQKLAIEREVYSKVHDDVAGSLDELAGLYEEREDFAAARTARQDVLKIRVALHGERDWRAADARRALDDLDRLARMTPEQRQRLAKARRADEQAEKLYAAGKYGECVPVMKRAAEIRKQLLGEGHPDYATNLDSLAQVYREMGDYTRAGPLFTQSRELRRRALGEGHPSYAESVNNYGGFCQESGDAARAAPFFRQALGVFQRAFGNEHPRCADCLNNLATLDHEAGDYARAEPLYRQASEICKQAQGTETQDYAMSLNNLAVLYQDMEDYALAEPLQSQAVEILKRTSGEKHPYYARALNNLALIYQELKEYPRAEALLRQAAAIDKQSQGEQHSSYATSLGNLALLYHDMGEDGKAEALQRQSLEIRRQTRGEKHPEYAVSLDNLARVYEDTGAYARAEPLMQKALEIRAQTLGKQHPDYARSVHNLAMHYLNTGAHAKAEPLFQEAVQIRRRSLDRAAAVQSQRQQLAMATALRSSLDGYLTLAARRATPAATAYAAVLAWKGSVWRRQRLLRIARVTTDPDIASLLEDLRHTTARFAALAFATPEPEEHDAWQNQLRDLTGRMEDLEIRLAQRSPAFRQTQEADRLTPERLKAVLPAGHALIDFLEYAHTDPPARGENRKPPERRLVAFVVRPGKAVVRLDLGPAAAIAAAIDRWRTAQLGSESTQQNAEAGQQLRKLLWQPLGPSLQGATMLLVSPDGALARFPLGALPAREPGRFLLEEISLAVVPVPQFLPELLGDVARPAAPSLLLVGDVDFGAAPGARAGQVVNTSAPHGPGRPRLRFDPLPASRDEVARIHGAFDDRFPGGRVTVLRGEAAAEAAAKREAPGHRWLHFATHAFFAPPAVRSALGPPPGPRVLPERAAAAVATAGPPGPGTMCAAALVVARGTEDVRAGDPFSRSGVAGWHPGLLSGLVFAGANRSPGPDQDDGILTALEVSELDLRGCDLAVLSACDTGLGASAGGEGLLGLQRAFQVAGARTVVATLWEVQDQAAGALMQRFYDNLWRRRMSKLEALREAQLHLLNEGLTPEPLARGPGKTRPVEAGALDRARQEATAKPPRTPPYYWAGFVLSGDWR
jgi:CHAT domain-containing protein/Tfp pilus assembly protein PilF